ncbi:efflux RND transporter periplasmic adaptor subunit [Winogradskyella aurantiaca]|uniref:efflux RND transporter periplasmic adaptor subunit n=1 Tax=Winogradskyella aurantiaca TaxID=2219558 RepID=UPI000E1E15B1|nr:HlyD family efflux transporter periplasmic adaptor subunit [Winogradskyella aurantiaca]
MLRKIILSFLGLALVIGSVFLSVYLVENKKRPKPRTTKIVKAVYVDTVANGTVPIRIEASGNLIARSRVELFAEVQGVFKPAKKLFRPGQIYKKGEALIRIDAAEYYASVQSAKSNLYNSIAAIMPDLRLDYPDVYDKWLTYLRSFDMEKSTPELPKMTSETENYFITGRGIVSSYYNVKNLEQRLSKYVISAPFNGILTNALVTEGSLVRNGQKLGDFIDTSAYEIEVAISKTYASMLKVGEEVSLTTLDGSSTYTGTVARINGSVDLTTQTITAFLQVAHPDLREGIYLEAEIAAKKETNAIQINRGLLFGNDQIFVVRDTLLDLIDVKPVYFSDKEVVVKGIPDGEVIVSKPVPGAYAGMVVKPVQSARNEK